LPTGKATARLNRRAKQRAVQLATHTRTYFPEYDGLLRQAYVHVLRSIEDASAIRLNGVVRLAAAKLPNVLTDVRRELRRRGFPFDVTLVADEIPAQRFGRVQRFAELGFKQRQTLYRSPGEATALRRECRIYCRISA